MATAAVVGCWELGWNTHIKEFELWTFPLRDLGCEEFYMAPVSGIEGNVIEIPELGEFITEQRASRTIVFVDEAGTTPLPEFEHPENALYVFGKTTLSPLVGYGLEDDLSIVIPTQINRGLLWAHQAATLVLYDRYLKCL